MNYIRKPFVLCAFNNSYVLEHSLLLSLGLQFKPVVGRYKGVDEASWLVLIDDNQDLERLKVQLKAHGQESYLWVNEDRQATLVYLDDASRIELGKFSAIEPNEALKHDNFTVDPATGVYYTCM